MNVEDYPATDHGRRCFFVCTYVTYISVRCGESIFAVIEKIGEADLKNLYEYADLMMPYPEFVWFDEDADSFGFKAIISDEEIARDDFIDAAFELYKQTFDENSADVFIARLLDKSNSN